MGMLEIKSAAEFNRLCTLSGVVAADKEVYPDPLRGPLVVPWKQSRLAANGLPEDFAIRQIISGTNHQGALRGVHIGPGRKIVFAEYAGIEGVSDECIVYKALVDTRAGKDFGKVFQFAFNSRIVISLPVGIGNSYQMLVPNGRYTYLCDTEYDPSAQAIHPLDPALAIAWPLTPLISAKDQANGSLEDLRQAIDKR